MSKKLTRSIVAAMSMLALVLGATGLSPAKPAPASAAGQSIDMFFNPTSVFKVYFTLPSETVDALNSSKTLKDYAAARVNLVTADGQQSGLIDIGLRLKGSTSLVTLSGKPSFKVKFNWSTLKGQRFLGLKRMTLNAMSQDGSMVHEAAAYRLYNLMGIPAPKTSYARVFVNGTDKGLYANIETVDDIFLSKRFTDVTQHLYEGVALNDFKPGKDNGTDTWGAFLVDEGWKAVPNKNDLTKLISISNMTTGASWWTAMGKYWDRKKLVMQFAVDNFTGNWDSYSGPIINNFYVRSNNAGKFTMMPWGVDQTFGENRQTRTLLDDYFFSLDGALAGFPWVREGFKKDEIPRGLLFQKCLKYAPCKTEYLNDLKLVMAKATSISTFIKQASSAISVYTSADVKAEQVRSAAWVGKQVTRVKALLKKNGIKY
jgi:spore coat protein CotH